MSTITATTSDGLVETILANLPDRSSSINYRVRVDDDKIEIDFVPVKGAMGNPDLESPDQRREYMRERLRKRAVRGVGLSDWAVSREAFYSEDF